MGDSAMLKRQGHDFDAAHLLRTAIGRHAGYRARHIAAATRAADDAFLRAISSRLRQHMAGGRYYSAMLSR